MVGDGTNLYGYSLHGLCTLPRHDHRLCEQYSQWHDQSDSLLPKPDNSAGRGADYQQQLRLILYGERWQHQRADDGLSSGQHAAVQCERRGVEYNSADLRTDRPCTDDQDAL